MEIIINITCEEVVVIWMIPLSLHTPNNIPDIREEIYRYYYYKYF